METATVPCGGVSAWGGVHCGAAMVGVRMSKKRPSRIRIWLSLPVFVVAKAVCWLANVVLGDWGYAAFITGPQGYAEYVKRVNEQTGEHWTAVRRVGPDG